MQKKKANFIIREITIEDAEAFLNLRIQTEIETPNMVLRPGERKLGVEDMAQKIEGAKKKGTIFLAEDEGRLIGFIGVFGTSHKIYENTREIAIAVLKAYWGQGVATALFTQALKWAKKKKIHRLQLDVYDFNKAAIKLYKKFGFKKEGVKKEAVRIGKKFIDVIGMGLILKR